MPRRGSISPSNSENVQRDTSTNELIASKEPLQTGDRAELSIAGKDSRGKELPFQTVDDEVPREFMNAIFVPGIVRQQSLILGSSINDFQSKSDRSMHLSEHRNGFDDHYSEHESMQSPVNELRDVHGAQYDGTGLSDDGRSLTPDPHSSEAETEHIASSDDDDNLTKDLTQEQRYPATATTHISENGFQDDDDDDDDDDIPADLDALSESDFSARSVHSDRSQDDIQDYEVEDVEDEQHNQSLDEDDVMEDTPVPVDSTIHTQVAIDNGKSIPPQTSTARVSRFGILASTKLVPTINSDDELDDVDDEIEEHEDNDLGGDDNDKFEKFSKFDSTLPGNIPGDHLHANEIDLITASSDIGERKSQARKRSRSPAVSPSNTKRLAPLKVHTELDSDEEGAEASALAADTLEDRFMATDAVSRNVAPRTVETSNTVTKAEIEAVRDSPEEDEEELDEVDEEVQDDTEREERNKHRQAAMEALRQIEVEFTKLRAKLYEERMKQIDREVALAENGVHPLVVEKTLQNQNRHTSRVRRAETLRDRRVKEASNVLNACKFIAHSQFSQDRQKLRATLLSKTSAEWFQIHREKRIIDMAVPEYGYLVPERRSTQLKQRREYEAEVSVLAGLKSFIGFPAAPSISTASGKDIDADLSEMGILKALNRDNHKQTHSARQHIASHPHNSVPSHVNHHLHNNHNHASHSNPHSKAHHRKPANSAKQRSAADKSDHHSQAHHLHARTTSPQITPRAQFHAHSYHGDVPVRKHDSVVTPHGRLNDTDSKPMLHSTNQEIKGHELARDKLPINIHKISQSQSGSYHQGSGSLSSSIQFEQKLAQNLPNILRQDSQEMKSKQLPALPHLANGNHLSNVDYLGSNGSKNNFAAQFWNPKHSEPSRTPAPAMSSNSAFNATLSQPGSSAAYIPPARTYSPAGQLQNTLYKSNQSHSTQAQQIPGKAFSVNNQFPTHSKELAVQHPPLFHPKAQQVAPDARVLFGPPLPPRQES